MSVLLGLCSVAGHAAASVDTAALNRTEAVKAGFQAFYIMDYDSALQQFQAVAAANPGDPLATDYVLDVTIFRELNRLDLLDTTFYANDGFLTGKHTVVEDRELTAKVRALAQRAQEQADARLARNGKDVDALYARGWARSLEATYTALVERAFPSALKLALGAKTDDEAVLKMDPGYVDANLVVGTYQYVIGALPRTFRFVIGVAGISGSKEKGMAMLQTSAAQGVLTSIEARTCMMLFLRRETQYGEATIIAQTLAGQYPHDYLFQLEVANLHKDAGQAQQAIAEYRRVLDQTRQPGYYHNAHLELAYFGLGDTLRGQRQYEPAAAAYRSAAALPTTSPELKQRCLLAAGKSFDLMHDHARATASYQDAINAGEDTVQGNEARKLIRRPFEGM